QVSNQAVHTGVVCEQGLACSSGRELSECFDIDVDPVDGSSALAYAAFGVTGTFITRQLSGASLYASKTVVDRAGVCPVAGGPCMLTACQVGSGDRCIAPGVIVACDPSNDESALGGPGDDITQVSIAEPLR